MNQTYHPIDYQTENMLDIQYNDLIEKKIKYLSIRLYKKIKILLKVKKTILKLTIVYIYRIVKRFLFYKYIKKIIPYKIKIKIKAKLLLFPKLSYVIKLLYSWLNNASFPKKNIPHYLLSFFIQRICLPLLHQMIYNLKWRSIVLERLNYSPNLRIKFKKIISTDETHASKHFFSEDILSESNIIISAGAQDIFRQFKMALKFYENSY